MNQQTNVCKELLSKIQTCTAYDNIEDVERECDVYFFNTDFKKQKIFVSKNFYKNLMVKNNKNYEKFSFVNSNDFESLINYVTNPKECKYPMFLTTIISLCSGSKQKKMILELRGDRYSENGREGMKGLCKLVDFDKSELDKQNKINGYLHDIKNQMMVICSLSTNIHKSVEDIKIKRYVSSIKDSILNVNSLLEKLRMNQEDKDTGNRLFNVHAEINSLVNVYECDDRITIIKKLNADNPRVYGEKHQINNCILNIIINAIQAMDYVGEVKIKTYNKKNNHLSQVKAEEWLFIDIKDNGAGISDEIIDKIFDNSFTTKSNGSGLGLCICKRVIENNNGTISVKSKENNSTTFTIALPSHIE